MSERHKTHNGRDRDGRFRVKQADVEELLEDPRGTDFVRDDVRLSGAIADTGAGAGAAGERIERIIEENRESVARVVRPTSMGRGKQRERRPPRRSRGKH